VKNIEHRTSNIERRISPMRSHYEHFDVRCSMFDVRCFSRISVLFVWLSIALKSFASNAPLVADASSPHATVRSVGLDEVKWTRGFWADRFELCRTQMVPAMERLMEGTNYSQFLQNFRIAAGLAQGRSRGASFNDGDFYKWMEGASATLAITNDPGLRASLDRIIEVIGQAQRADGYLHTPVLIRQRNGDTNAVPFREASNFEMYNMGHLLTAACVHQRVTGQTNFLAIARKAADFLGETFRHPTPELASNSVCPSHYMGMIELYRTTREPRYLELAKTFLAMRDLVKNGTDDNQDRIHFDHQTEAAGHAARANYLYAGAADLFLETGDEKLMRPLESIWTNLVEKKMYVTGGCGALYDGASPDAGRDQRNIARIHQAYGRNYQLPNVTAHNETCANIGNVLWNWRMFLATGEAKFMDVAELALYNSVLSGVALDGTNFFYTNPLRVTEPLPTDLRWSRTRVPFVSSFCCPPNLVRTVAELGAYAYGKSDNAIWVNLYGGSTLATELPDGRRISLTQETEYPWSGRVRLVVNECAAGGFALKLRIPGWSKGATVRINNAPTDFSGAPASYLELRRDWKAGDMVYLDFAMPVRLLEANPLVEEDLDQVAIQRGPMIYCLESTDLPRDARITGVSIPANVDLNSRYDSRLLGGVVVLEGTGLARSTSDWSGRLYRDAQPNPARPLRLRLIPYFAWDNRGVSEMSVWLQRDGW
jgi:DUF1680 family protein